MVAQLAEGWSMDLGDGDYQFDTENNGQTEVFWCGGRTVRVTAMRVVDTDGSPVGQRHLLATLATGKEEGAERVQLEKDYLRGWAEIGLEEEDGSLFWRLHGCCAMDGRVCIVGISFDDPDDRQWAISTWQTLYRPLDS